ncbi:MAG: TetR/AcrR family transcriptional regulator [Candidatus Aminicenantes bacterium]|nr:TetR/AcrR family transcriptional regulator [Candidatus Aminicenantes bacterium]MDH5705165.1 TetR/AcrR family transcriptional regulator [Candidatus Aminicenantes bacterium]
MKKKDLKTERKRYRREENKKFILKAAEKVFVQKGFSLATMDEIAKEAQFSKATLYQYFKSKSEMFFEIIYKSFEEVLQKIKRVQQTEMSTEEKLKQAIYTIGCYYHTKKNIARIFIMEKALMRKLLHMSSKAQAPPTHHPPIPARYRGILDEINSLVCEIIEEGVKTGEFRKMDVGQACFILGAMIRGFYFKGPIQDKKELSIQESADLLHDFFLHGIKK